MKFLSKSEFCRTFIPQQEAPTDFPMPLFNALFPTTLSLLRSEILQIS
jgi:hypothetical protein